MDWYTVSVVTGREDNVEDSIKSIFGKSVSTLVPRRQMIFKRSGGIRKNVLQTLFPGYIFIQAEMDKNMCKKINQMKNVLSIVSDQGQCLKVDDHEMNMILKLVNKGGIIEISKLLKTSDHKPIVLEGPLFGMEQFIQRVNRRDGYAIIRINPYDTSRTVSVGVEIVQLT